MNKTSQEYYEDEWFKDGHGKIDGYEFVDDSQLSVIEVMEIMDDYHKHCLKTTDQWTKYDPNDESTFPKEDGEYIVWIKDKNEDEWSIADWEQSEFQYVNKTITHYQERPSKPIE